MQPPRYSYGSICAEDGDFRLLNLSKDLTAGRLAGNIISASLQNAPVYKTISYCWGDRDDSEEILVDGALLRIPINAANCLKRIRMMADEQLIWIDTVCIDQTNLSERGAQVSNMGRVYGAAECNLVYLGEQNLKSAYQDVIAINQEMSEETDGYSRLYDVLRPNNTWSESHTPLRMELERERLEQLFELPWFKRAWVLQEASLAQKNICLSGDDVFELLPIVRAGVWLAHKATVVDLKTLAAGAYRMMGFFDLIDREHGWYAKNKYTFAQLIRMAAGSLCTLPVDRVYAVRGMMEKHDVPGWQLLRPDYTIPKERIFEIAMRVMLAEDDGILACLVQVCHVKPLEWHPGRKLMPSWAQDWSADPEDSLYAQMLHWFYAANRSRQANNFLVEDDNFKNGVLPLTGMSIDHVETLLDPMNKGEKVVNRQAIPGIVDEIENTLKARFTDPAMLESALAQVPPLMLATAPNEYRNAHPEVSRSWSHFRAAVNLLRDEPRSPAGDDTAAQEAASCGHYCSETCRNRRFVISKNGSLGLAPLVTEKGDLIAVIDGLPWPAYLRSVPDGHQFVGVGYLDEVMDGNWIVKQRDLGRQPDVFNLV